MMPVGGLTRISSRNTSCPKQNGRRYEADAWEDDIRRFLGQAFAKRHGRSKWRALRLAIETPRIGTAEQRRIAAVLEQLGWRRLKKDWEGNRWWVKTC